MKTLQQQISEAAAVGQTVFDRLQQVVDPVINKMDENAPDDENARYVLGLLIGVRAWVGQFEALEDHCVTMLDGSFPWFSRDRYERMRMSSETLGIAVVDLVQKLVEQEERQGS